MIRKSKSCLTSRKRNVITGTLVVISLVLAAVGVLGTLEVLGLRRKNKELQGKLTQVEQKISTSVEERLISHTKYCERVESLVQKQLEIEEEKWRELVADATCRMREELAANEALTKHELDKTMSNFKALLSQSYLDEYEKMRRSPPRPKKGPRKKIEPPQRYRSLDAEFNFCPPAEPAKPAEPS
jgi:hypothetical protein